MRNWLLLLACMAAPALAATDGAAGSFVQRRVELAGRTHAYQVFIPHGLAPGAPVILFLHGSGERGDDGVAPTRAGLGPWLRKASAFPALVVFPQVPREQEWLGENLDLAVAALDATTAEFGADRRRTYLTGMSMGGYGVWELALRLPDRFAALAPVCGALLPPRPARPTLRVAQAADEPDPYAHTVARLAHVPVWSFHGALDDLVPPYDDRRLHRRALAAGAPWRYTEYPQGNHNAWDSTYTDPAFWRWLFDQRRR